MHDVRARSVTDTERQGEDATAMAIHTRVRMTQVHTVAREPCRSKGPAREIKKMAPEAPNCAVESLIASHEQSLE
jgi:hypothetical protein